MTEKPKAKTVVWYVERDNVGGVALVFRMHQDGSLMERYDWRSASWVDASERLGRYLTEGNTDIERTHEEAAMQLIAQHGSGGQG